MEGEGVKRTNILWTSYKYGFGGDRRRMGRELEAPLPLPSSWHKHNAVRGKGKEERAGELLVEGSLACVRASSATVRVRQYLGRRKEEALV